MSWTWTTLDAVLAAEPNALMDGPFGSKLKREHYTRTGVRVVRLGNLGVGEFKDDDKSFVSQSHGEELGRHSLRAGDLLIAALAEPVGRCCEVPVHVLPAIAKADCIRFRPRADLNRRFLMHWFNSPIARENAEGFSHGVGRLRINMEAIRSLPIPIPTREVQDVIVTAIETHFSRLDAAVALLQRAKANIARARASVLKAAVEGRLVPTEAALARAEGRSFEPAAVLLERILVEREAAWKASGARGKYQAPVRPEVEGLPELPDGWCWATMDCLLHGIDAGKSFEADCAAPSGDQVGIVKVSAVTWGVFDEDEAKTVHDPLRINPEYFIRRGDLLMSRANTIELVGAVVVAERVTRRVMLSDKILRLRMPPAYRRYALHVLRSQLGRRQIQVGSSGNQESMRNIGQAGIRQITIPLPPWAEQHRITAETDRRLTTLAAIESTLDTNLARCARLRQSILQRAFEGRLVPAADASSSAPPGAP